MATTARKTSRAKKSKKVIGTVSRQKKRQSNRRAKVKGRVVNRSVIDKALKSAPNPILEKTSKKIQPIQTMDFREAYDYALDNPNVQFSVVCPITPDLAVWILAHLNTKNRDRMERLVLRYANEMICGRWMEGVDGGIIEFDSEGICIEGQHRIGGVISSGKTVYFHILFNKNPEAYVHINDGGPKRIRDMLKMAGIRFPNVVDKAITIMKRFEMSEPTCNHPVSNQESLQIINRHPKLEDSAVFIKKAQTRVVMSESVACALHYLFSMHSKTAADVFIQSLSSGEGLKGGSPIHTLRERLIRAKSSNQKNLRLTRNYTLAIAIKAWNAFRAGREDVYRIFWSKGEDFPKIA